MKNKKKKSDWTVEKHKKKQEYRNYTAGTAICEDIYM